MAKQILNNLELRLTELIESEIKRAIHLIEGVSLASFLNQKSEKSKSVEVFFLNQIVDICIYIDVRFGVYITDLSCNLQQQIKAFVEKNTKFNVRKVNIFVSDIIL